MNASSSKSRNRLRIIGGQWRSRLINFPDIADLRPTPDRVRETLFNWLQLRITGAHCLDLFAGSGILGIEALSRGASAVTAIELDPKAGALIQEQAAALGSSAMTVIKGDVLTRLGGPPPARPFDVVFIDPPYATKLQSTCCALLAAQPWLQPGALIYLEAAEPLETLALPQGWRLLRSKRAADVYFGLCQAPD